MLKRLSMLALTMLLTMSMAIPVFATPGGINSRLMDEVGVLSDTEKAILLDDLDEVSERQGMDVVIAVVGDFDAKDVDNAAYDYYDYGGFSKDGILLYLSMAERDYCISGTGFGIEAFTDYGREKMAEEILPYLGNDDFFTAFDEYISICDNYITEAKAGTPYDVGHEPEFPETLGEKIMGALMFFFAPVIAAFAWIKGVVIRGNRKKLISVESVDDANRYKDKSGFVLADKNDTFVNSYVTQVLRPKNDTDGGGGGSTMSFGSSGVGHSSTSGKF